MGRGRSLLERWEPMIRAVGLYLMVHRAKTQPERLLDHPLRRALREAVLRDPAANVAMLASDVGANRGTVAYHLRLLEDAGIIQSLHVGRDRHFFAPDAFGADASRMGLIRQDRMRALVELVIEHPGIIQKDLNEGSGMSRKVSRGRLDTLMILDLIEERNDGKNRRYTATERLLDLWKRLIGRVKS